MEPNKAAHWSYYIEFVIVPVVSLILLVFAVSGIGIATLALAGFGMIVWTLLEYLIHRYPLHHWPYFSVQHDFHHRYPKSYVGISTLGVLIMFGAGGYSLSLITTAGISAAIFAGILAAYGQYIFIHHMLHHRDPIKMSPELKRLWDHHAGHHRGGDWNFGVSTIFWDKRFGTLRP